MPTNKPHAVAMIGIFVGLAMVFSYIESLIPLPSPIPGIRLGLANLVILIPLYIMGFKQAIIISLLRILLVTVTFGNPYTMIYSLAGGLFSLFIMYLSKKYSPFSILGVSMLGGVSHNIGQIIVAGLVIENFKIIFYLPILIISGLISGLVIGVFSSRLLPYLK